MSNLAGLGKNLRNARKARFPADGIRGFALRIGVSPATLQKMEAGELSVTLSNYHKAAQVLGVSAQFNDLFKLPDSLFDD